MRWKARPFSEWNRWFAWRPVHIADEWVWLEWVERRPVETIYPMLVPFYDYRALI